MQKKTQKSKKATKPTVWIAAVVKQGVHIENLGIFGSARQFGDWACFVGRDKLAVINRALEAQHAWEVRPGRNYRIVVGKLTSILTQPCGWTEVAL